MSVKTYDIAIYAPDRHIQYDAQTPDRVGVGGGIMARIRLGRAFAELGHRVTLIANCPREQVSEEVRYLPLDAARRIECDVVVPTTSGGALDFSPFLEVNVRARICAAWVHGTQAPGALHDMDFDYLYTPSNFIRRVAIELWGIQPAKTFVTYNGAERAHPGRRRFGRRSERDPFRLIYASHPSKGLSAALGILRLLRQDDPRFHLHVYGSRKLWGEVEEAPQQEAGVTYHGMLPQPQVTRAMRRANFSINLQIRDEGLPLVGVEALHAGCLILASPVGGYSEIIEHGRNGFIVTGDHLDPSTWRRSADLIRHLLAWPGYAEFVRKNARAVVWDWTSMARTWLGHWDWIEAGSDASATTSVGSCEACGGRLLGLADGLHCIDCGHYALAMRRAPAADDTQGVA